jgi:3-oxoacyl-[acyl-carrier protein] reductase
LESGRKKNSVRAFAGAVAIVTGSASGIGRALTEAVAHRGVAVVLTDLQDGLASEVVARIRSAGGDIGVSS